LLDAFRRLVISMAIGDVAGGSALIGTIVAISSKFGEALKRRRIERDMPLFPDGAATGRQERPA
jgi:hypothetical protein